MSGALALGVTVWATKTGHRPAVLSYAPLLPLGNLLRFHCCYRLPSEAFPDHLSPLGPHDSGTLSQLDVSRGVLT